ncbi:MAG TPA: DUF6249 domain-containing protein [Puia sp.]
MKKLIAIIPGLFMFAAANAQDKTEQILNQAFIIDVFHICATIFLLYLSFNFILALLQRSLNHRIRMKIVETGTSETLATQVLEKKKKDYLNEVLAWICVLLAIGAGLTLITLTLPFGLHSVAILAFSIGLGLLVFYLIARRRGTK